MKKIIFILLFMVLSFVNLYGFKGSSLMDGNHFFVGYVVNIPTEYFGVVFLYTRSKAIGFFLDAKLSLPGEPDPYYSTITKWEAEVFYGDPKIGNRSTYFTTNIALTWVFSKRFGLYAGLGYTIFTKYNQYDDLTNILGDTYWIKVDEKEGLNFLGGLMFIFIEDIASHVGLETNPFGVTVGIDFKLDSLFR